jgi:hypothetical protein
LGEVSGSFGRSFWKLRCFNRMISWFEYELKRIKKSNLICEYFIFIIYFYIFFL